MCMGRRVPFARWVSTCLLVVLTIAPLGCQRGMPPEQIQSHLEQYASRELLVAQGEGRVFAAVDIFGSSNVGQGKSHVFAWCLVAEVKPDLNFATAVSMPVKFIIEQGAFGGRVMAHRVPMSGSEYWESIQGIFPAAYHQSIRNFSHQTSDREQRLLAKAREHFRR